MDALFVCFINALFVCFGQQFWKSIVIFQIRALECGLLQSLVCRKNSYISNQKCLTWVFLARIFEKLLSYLKLMPSNLAYYKVWYKKHFIFGTKNALFGCFGQQFWKIIVIFEISSLEFVFLQSVITKIPKIGTKSAWFGYF